MNIVTFQGEPVFIGGDIPQVGALAPDFTLCAANLGEITLEQYRGKQVILNIFPSIDTPICAQSTIKFNKMVSQHDDTVVLCISADLPFAISRFCADEGLENVVIASCFRHPEFLDILGCGIEKGILRGLAARMVVVLDANGYVTHCELVSEITHEPNYDLAINALRASQCEA
ncbi:thiol peroxidase [Pseudoalteromonas xiamenensis]|uniref:Thiol peroxidase n=1 Tax=Pseudoalteromonas xiamenensis TaxID=882626 RepID=A0A975DI19_9GAMM|nr:thiol peroxidase [Pseudoalteromonas xiamenensis]QTH72238.1 thiol peroxidase [Pseudoalteromonas xiamenensis]